jgi:hypothetical protein
VCLSDHAPSRILLNLKLAYGSAERYQHVVVQNLEVVNQLLFFEFLESAFLTVSLFGRHARILARLNRRWAWLCSRQRIGRAAVQG